MVVWPNGVAGIDRKVGLWRFDLPDRLESIVTLAQSIYRYRGNDGTVTPHPRLIHFHGGRCSHYAPDAVGDPVFKKL